MSQAFSQAKANRGAPGVDGIGFGDIESAGVEEWLDELRAELMEDRYRPSAVRRVKIPKPGGGERSLGIPTIRDRVVQTAVVLILEPIFEADLEDNVYAYRPGRSAHDALGEVRERLYGGQTHVVDAIVSYADDFVILCRSQQQAVRSLELVTRWLTKLGLRIHPVKTRTCHARAEPFDFLGYTFGPCINWRTGRSILSAAPSKKSVRRLKGKINALLYRGNPTPWPELRGRLNSVLRGWAKPHSARLRLAQWPSPSSEARRP